MSTIGNSEEGEVVSQTMPEFGLRLSAPEQNHLRILVVGCVAVGVGTRLAPHLRSQAFIKAFAQSMNVADGFMKGATAIHSPSPSNLFLLTLATAKAIVKRAKLEKISKGLKAWEGGLNVVRYSSVLKYSAGDPVEQAIKGYKWTKGALKVLDGVKGGEYGGVKEGMRGVDVVVKAMTLSKRMHGLMVNLEGFRVSHGVLGLLWDDLKNEKQAWKRRARQGETFLLPESI